MIALVELLYTKGADIHATSDIGNTPLMAAAINGHLAVVKRLVEWGVDIHAQLIQVESGYTALHLAAKKGHLKVVKFLSSKGASLEAKAVFDETPLHLAAKNGHLSVVEYLVEQGVDIHAQIRYDRNVDSAILADMKQLHIAQVSSSFNMPRSSISHAYILHNKQTALDYAKKEKNKDVIQYLEHIVMQREK